MSRDGSEDEQRGQNDYQGNGGQQEQQGDGGQDQQQGNGEQQGQNGEQGNGGQRSGQDQQQDGGGQSPSTAETVLTAISVVVTVLLFGYVAWHAIQPTDSIQPQVEVVETEQLSNGSVLVRVEFVNQGDQGLLSATVEVTCAQPPPDATFENVPAGGVQRAVLVCPPGTESPDVEVSAWVPT